MSSSDAEGSSEAEERASRILRDLSESEHEHPDAGPQSFPKIPRYDVRQLLGEGATAVVYRAWDRELNLHVALKVLKEAAGWSEITRQRFRREAQATAALNDPHLVRVFDVGETPPHLYLVMELVDGKPLSHCFLERRFEPNEIVRLIVKVARGVAAAHAKGIIHRDLKPANILVGKDGEPKVADFGLAHLGESETVLTRTGTVLGTPLYMSPEQVLGRVGEISVRTDVYGLGAILYEALTGEPPHSGQTVAEIYAKIVQEETLPPRKRRANIPRDLETICMKALEREKERRYSTASEFADDLERFLAGEPVRAKPASLLYRARKKLVRHRTVLGVAAVLLVAGGLFFFWWRTEARRYETAFRRGLEEWNRRSGERALEEFRKAAEADPRRPEPWVMIGRSELVLGREDRAFEAWEGALRRDPGCKAALFERGKQTLGRHVVRRLPPPVDVSTGWLPLRLIPAESLDGATEEIGKIRADLKAGGEDLPEYARFVKGAIDLLEGRYRDSEPPLRAYTDLNEWDAGAMATLGIASHFGSFQRRAERALSVALALRSEKSWHKARGDARYLQGHYEGARSDYARAGVEREAEPLFSRKIPSQGLILWLRADAGVDLSGFVVSRWSDQSGGRRDAAPKDPLGGPKVTAAAINGLPAVLFAGKDDELHLPEGFEEFSAGLSVFAVGEPMMQRSDLWSFISLASGSGAGASEVFLGRRRESGPVAYWVQDPKSRTTPFVTGMLTLKEFEGISAVQEPSGTARLYRRGTLLAADTLPALRNSLRTRNRVGAGFKGHIAEVVLYNRSLSDLERLGVDAYLKSRYFPDGGTSGAAKEKR